MARSNYRGRKRKCAHKSKAVIEKQSGDKVDSSRSDSNSTDHDEENLKSPKKKVRWGLTANAEDDVENSMEKSDSDTAERDQTADENIVLAICAQYGRLGCAYYDPIKLVLFVLEDTSESTHHDITKLVLDQIKPDVVLTSSRADESSMDVIRDFMDASGGVFQVRPAKDFIPNKGRDRLLSLDFLLNLPVEQSDAPPHSPSSDVAPTNAYDFMRSRRDATGDPILRKWNATIRLGNFVALERSPLCIASIGALLDHFSRVRALTDLDNDNIGQLDIQNLETINLDQIMQINADALSSLQIFDTENHASVHSDKTKEGLSLFGILNSTRTSLGRSLLRQWLLRPSLSIPEISARHDVVECFVNPDNVTVVGAMQNNLKGLKNVPRILNLLKSGKASLNEWQGLVKFTFHAALLRESLTELRYAGGAELLKKLLSVLDVTNFRDMGNTIHETIDWEESSYAGRICVRPNIDEELDHWKHIYNGIDGVLSRVAEQISESVPPSYAPSLNVVYFPQLGFLITVPMQESWKSGSGVDVLDGWIFQFSSESYVYFKSKQMHDLDRHIGDLHPSIVDREIEIMQSLLEKILIYGNAITQVCEACAELDCLLCFAEASRTYNYNRPTLVEDNVIIIKQGRHPLQELVVDTFVPNDISMAGGLGLGTHSDLVKYPDSCQMKSIFVLTGANACGKSIFIKQTALIQVMAQIGCFVSAESATLGIVDKIFTRIQTKESASKIQSAFMIDLNQVSLALRNSTPRTLILLDEFGKGTISADGAGLFCGVLREFLSLGYSCPKVLSATHFHDVFHKELLDPDLPISFFHMQFLISEDEIDAPGSDDEGDSGNTEAQIRRRRGETITYLYRATPGLSYESHAARCAKMFGLPGSIVRRAQYISELLSTHNLTRLLDEEMTAKEIQELEEAEAVCRRFMEWDLDSFGGDNIGCASVKARLGEVLGK